VENQIGQAIYGIEPDDDMHRVLEVKTMQPSNQFKRYTGDVQNQLNNIQECFAV
jgi:hypothetical protein